MLNVFYLKKNKILPLLSHPQRCMGEGIGEHSLSEQVDILCFRSLRGIWASSWSRSLVCFPNSERRGPTVISVKLDVNAFRKEVKVVCCCSAWPMQALPVLQVDQIVDRERQAQARPFPSTEDSRWWVRPGPPPALCALCHSRKHFTNSLCDVVKTVLNLAR